MATQHYGQGGPWGEECSQRFLPLDPTFTCQRL